MAFHNDLNFVKRYDDDSNPANTSETADVGPSPGVSKTPSSSGLGSQTWATGDQATALPTADGVGAGAYMSIHNLVPLNGFVQGDVDSSSTNDMTGASPDKASNRPTPNSSTASEQRHSLTAAAAARMNGSGRNSFEASPVPSNQNLNMAGPEVGQQQQQQGVNGFFGAPPPGGPFSGLPPGVGAGLATDHQRFSMAGEATVGGGGGGFVAPHGWGDLSGQSGMTPVAEGVFRSIMTMGSIDTMDLGWETNP